MTALALGTTLAGASADDPPAASPYTYSVGAPIAVTFDGALNFGPWGLAVDPTTHTVYASNYDASTIDVVNGTTRTLVRGVKIGPGEHHPRGFAVDPSAHKGYFADGSTIGVLNLSTNTVTATIPADQPSGGVGVDQSTHRLYATWDYVNNPPGEPVPHPPPNGAVTLYGPANDMTVDQSTHAVLTTDYDANTLKVIDPSTGSATSVTVGRQPSGVAVDPGTHSVYTANYGDGTVSVVDETSRTVTGTIAACARPLAVAVDPSTHTVYVPCANPDEPFDGDGTVAVIDGTTGAVTDSLPVGGDPFSAAVDPTTHTLWVGNYTDGTVQPITQKANDSGGTRGSLPPALRSASSHSGPTRGGQKVTLTGSGFTGTTRVSFGTASASFTVVSDTSIVATTPAHKRGAAGIRIRTPAGLSTGTWGSVYLYR